MHFEAKPPATEAEAADTVVRVVTRMADLPADAWNALAARHPTLAPRRGNLAASVNRRYASFDAPLGDGDEVVFIPPVSGG